MKFYKIYLVLPTKAQVAADLEAFIKLKGEKFNGPIKIGKSHFIKEENLRDDYVSNRYHKDSRYQALTIDNVFAECGDEEIALAVESMAQEIMIEKNLLLSRTSNGEGKKSNDSNKRYFVYLATLKPELHTCPSPRCSYVSTHSFVLKHRLIHDNITDVLKANKVLASYGEPPMDILIDPTPFIYSRVDRQLTCQHCGELFMSQPNRSTHEIYHCPKNLNKREPIKCELCTELLVGEKSMKNHLMMVHKKETFVVMS